MLGQLVQLMHQRLLAHKAVNPGDVCLGVSTSAYDLLIDILLPSFASIPQVCSSSCHPRTCSPLLRSSFASTYVVHSFLCEHLKL